MNICFSFFGLMTNDVSRAAFVLLTRTGLPQPEAEVDAAEPGSAVASSAAAPVANIHRYCTLRRIASCPVARVSCPAGNEFGGVRERTCWSDPPATYGLHAQLEAGRRAGELHQPGHPPGHRRRADVQ